MIGAPLADDACPGEDSCDSGAAYAYRLTPGGWAGPDRILPRFPRRGARFGTALTLKDGLAAIGAPGDDELSAAAGAVHLFRHDGTTWSEVEKLLPPDAADPRVYTFGRAVDLDRFLVVGAPPVAYVYQRVGVSVKLLTRLGLPGLDGSDGFGSAVATGDRIVLVGAPESYGVEGPGGAAYIFSQNEGIDWSKWTVRLSGNEASTFRFGSSFGMGKSGFFVGGSPRGDGPATLYRFFFASSGLLPFPVLVARTDSSLFQFPLSLSVDGDTVLLGVPGNPGQVLRLSPADGGTCRKFLRGDCNQDGKFDISDPLKALGILFSGESNTNCSEACDSDDSNVVDISDPVAFLSFLFLGGPAPSPPSRTAARISLPKSISIRSIPAPDSRAARIRTWPQSALFLSAGRARHPTRERDERENSSCPPNNLHIQLVT